MPGGKFHWPLWVPYELYGTVDYIYGWPAWEARNGFTAAQGMMNIVESGIYVIYLWVVYNAGSWTQTGKKTTQKKVGALGWLGGRASVSVNGRMGAWAILLGFTGAIMTLSKTALYGKFTWCNSAVVLRMMGQERVS